MASRPLMQLATMPAWCFPDRPRTSASKVSGVVPGFLLCFLLGISPAWGQSVERPVRVVTLAPHITEMVYAAGAGTSLVGTVVSSDYPVAARKLPKVGDGASSVSVEKLAHLAPDLVLAWQETGVISAAARSLQGLHIPVEYVAPGKLDDIPDQIQLLGKRLGTSLHADQTAAKLRADLDALRKHYAERPKVSVFIEIDDTPLYAVGNDVMLNDALRTCGGVNVFSDSPLAALPIGPEHILHKHPDVIIVAQATPQREQQAAARWAALGLNAGSGTRVSSIDPDTLFRPGPRFIEATQKLCEALETARR